MRVAQSPVPTGTGRAPGAESGLHSIRGMNGPSVVTLLETGICLYVAVLSWRVSRAPGWVGQAWFALLALIGAAFSGAAAVTYSPTVSDQMVLAFSQIQASLALVQGAVWIRYANVQMGRAHGKTDSAACALLVALGVVAVLPGVVFSGEVVPHEVLGATYRITLTTPVGSALLGLALAVMALLAWRFLQAWRRGVRHAGLHALAMLALVAFGVNDVLVTAEVLAMPYLSDLGVLAPMSIVGFVLAERFVEGSAALEAAQRQLESMVQERTRQLAAREAALLRTEKLAALGRLSSGVAHEISSPLGAVTANIHFLSDALRRGEVPDDAAEAMEESLESLQRIAGTVRHLYDAGRVAGRSATSDQVVDLSEVAPRALAEARARVPRDVQVQVEVEEGLTASGEARVVEEVVVSLLKNALRAIPEHARKGRVVVRASRAGERVRLAIEDNGVGMGPEAQRTAFEPFASTWSKGGGAGLGLAVSRGLVTSLGGDLSIESALGEGTSVVLELPAARAPAVTH
jgi:two-component system NtrC family sensor kinase